MSSLRVAAWSLVCACSSLACAPESTEGPNDPLARNLVGEDHVFVELRLQDSPQALLSDTTEIQASLYYSPCISAFYREQPQWSAEAEQGQVVFDEARDVALCPGVDPGVIDCDVIDLRQDLYGDDQLLVRYSVLGSTDGRIVRVGPLPLPELAGCEDEASPFAGHVALMGLDGEGQMRWVSSSLARVPIEQQRPPTVSVTTP